MGKILGDILEAIFRGADEVGGVTARSGARACRGSEFDPSCWSDGEKLLAVLAAIVVVWLIAGWRKGKNDDGEKRK